MIIMKKSKKQIFIFPILFIIFPLVFFFVISLIKYINTGTFNYLNNFQYLYISLQNIKEYLLPSIIFFTLGLIIILINKFRKRKTLKIKGWIFLEILGILMILIGNRVIFLIQVNVLNNEIFSFLINAVNFYSFVIACELTFLVSFILNYFDTKYLK